MSYALTVQIIIQTFDAVIELLVYVCRSRVCAVTPHVHLAHGHFAGNFKESSGLVGQGGTLSRDGASGKVNSELPRYIYPL